MLQNVKDLFITETGKDTAVVLVGTLINALVGGLFFIVAPRILGPANYGLFSVVTSTGILVATLANLGIDTGILRFAKKENSELTNKIYKLALETYTFIGLAIFVLGLLLSPVISQLLNHPELTNIFRIAFSGIIFFLLTDFFIAVLQSKGEFFKASLLNIVSNSTRILILAIASYFLVVNLYFLTALFFFVSITSVIVGKLFVPLDFLKASEHRNELKGFFGYNSWVAAAVALSAIPADNYILLKYGGAAATGIYAAPFKLISVIRQFTGNFSRVLAPRLTSFQTDKLAIDFVKKTIPIVAVFFTGTIMLSLIARPVVLLLLGESYIESVPVFRIIALSYSLAFIETIPVSIIVYYFGKTKVAFNVTVISMSFWACSLLLLVPKYHVMGAAYSLLIWSIVSVSLFTTYVVWKLSARKNGKN